MALKSAFLTGILAHVPEADRGKAETELDALEKGSLRQSDYSKLADEAKTAQDRFDALYAANTEWFETRKAELAEVDTLRTRLAAAEKAPVVASTSLEIPADVVRKADLDKMFETTERGAVAFIAEANILAVKHFKEFGDVLDITKLLADKRVQQIGLQGVYAEQFKEPIAAKAKAAEDARAESFREEGRMTERERIARTRQPYPVVGNEPSALDAIEASRTGEKPVVKSLDDMAAEYARLSGGRAGATA
jgi:hypothetical protein